VEAHFYLILPLLLWMKRRSPYLPIAIVLGATFLRFVLYQRTGQVQYLAYWTIIGRIDQFVWGIVLFSFRRHLTGRHLRIAIVLSAFCLFFQFFDRIGGFYQNIAYPSPDPLWILLPSIEGFAYACAIAWYDTSFQHKVTGISGVIGKFGAYSYSIYLFHWFVVFDASRWIHTKVLDLSSFSISLLVALLCFLSMFPVGWLSYRFIESPFLKKRTRYVSPLP
jgi:peptidoglycan/LPS O-acetylase OafA/YrhL